MATAANRAKTVRFMLLILAFVAVIMLFVFLVVIPSIKTYKSKKAAWMVQKREKRELSAQQKRLEEELGSLRQKYARPIKAFQSDFDEEAFLALARKYFHNVRLTPKSHKKSESGLQIYDFKADFDARTPVQFYRFVEALQQMDNVVKINFPLIIDAQNSTIHLQFNMSVYRL